ncbi:hypothetical protein JTE90_001268 [Oedothorax gibbosus]|uniref:Uncharacterized protein n=1 Tax=Oedothorax gibbosus TaxID=931172 RepID=A0AAV6V463_9ARAC|nr:hypothetical protein JTE90_001268 [Oedothorax gibbosus]
MCSVVVLPMCAVVVGTLCFVLQFVVLPSDEWGHFMSRRIRGVPVERGHYGLWRLCSSKASGGECVHPDSFPGLPTQAKGAGATALLHLLATAAFAALALVRVAQVVRKKPDMVIGTRRLLFVKVAVALAMVVMSISVCILASVGEGTFKQYEVYKGWAFWIQIVIVSVDIVLLLVCAFENIQWWQMRMTEPPPPDPADLFPETFITPDYDMPPPSPTPSGKRPSPNHLSPYYALEHQNRDNRSSSRQYMQSRY